MPTCDTVAASESDLAAEEREVELELAGLGPRRPERLQYTSPTETGGVASVTDVEDEGPVNVDPNASRAERRRAERANKKRKKR